MDLTLYLVAFIPMLITHICVVGYRRGCESPQYLEIGKAETILCSFKEDFDSINWYFNLDVTDGPPTVSYENQIVRGEGVENGEFDIREDGSLIINNVSIKHETRFTVYEVETADHLPIRHDVDIVTIVRPDPPYPVIEGCSSIRGFCYIQWNQGTSLMCRVGHARPALHLTIVTKIGDLDVNIRTSTDFLNQTNTWTSLILETNPFMYSSYLALIICKAESEINLLERNETTILVQNKDVDMSSFEITQVAVQRNQIMRLPCSGGDYQLLVWEKVKPSGESAAVIVDIRTKSKISNNSNDFKLQEGELVVDKISVSHEGLYRCTVRNNEDEELVKQLHVIVYIPPVPNFPIVEGCPYDRYCVLQLTYQGTLTCHVRGIRPEVKLEWRTYHEETKKMISFHNQQLKTILNDETSDITLITEYTATEKTERRLTVECRAVGLNSQHFTLNTQVELLFSSMDGRNTTEVMPLTTSLSHGPSSKMSLLTGLVVIVVFLVVITGVSLALCKVCSRNEKRQTSSRNDEHIPMMKNEDKNKKNVFISQLKSTYANLYNGLKPIPFFDEHCAVDELFVEGGIEFMSKITNIKWKWEVLDSYKDIFNHPKLTHNHWIIEGGPGYGKSTLCLQLAYEWCHGVDRSFMSSIDLFIFIRLRQLKGVSSIYQAIKLFCLPKDSDITIDDIKTTISEATSVLIILDGFDEYPDRDSDTKSDVFEILKRHKLPECRVVITTRPSRLPKGDISQANHLRLTGFQAEAQELYLQKVTSAIGEASTTNTVQEWLEGNPVLRDLLEVPLFFVMYSHLTLEHDTLTKCTSVTTFFRFIITCLHAHYKRKQKDEKVERFTIDENEHQTLDKFCFSQLNGHTYNPCTEKVTLFGELGKEFVEMYIKIGIFQEEKTIKVSNDPGIQANQHVVHITNVKLYHNLFCEWYAAHHLVQKLNENNNSSVSPKKVVILERLDPEELQYVYRFACGLDSKSAEHILDYFNQTVQNTAFSILCILEQFGKVDAILKNVREVCNETISIRNDDPRIVQKSVIKLLEIASSKMLTVPKLVLVDCFKSVNSLGNEIILKTEARLPVLDCVYCLWLEQQETELTQDDLDDVFKYAIKCQILREVSFVYSLTPYIFKVESSLKQLCEKDIKVMWYVMDRKYILDLSSGIWKKSTADASEMTQQEYKQIEKMFRLMSL